jgi:bifunctional UDP-N-acetylglucosamine pyrophosphorylase/glucosamine-1-phosphate N-acetyltransferase
MKNDIGMCVLAAGKGTRLKWDGPKALAPLLGRSLIDFPLNCINDFSKRENLKSFSGVVTGHLRETVEAHVKAHHADKNLHFALQDEQKGTADALKAYFQKIDLASSTQFTMVICADTPLIESSDLSLMFNEFKNHPSYEFRWKQIHQLSFSIIVYHLL